VRVLVLDAATIPPLELLKLNGFAMDIEAVERSVPPERVTVPFGLFRLLGEDTDTTPAAIVVPPEYVLVLDNTVVPVPT
jgi:hypothetical protein